MVVNKIKKHIFIASSTESLNIANKVKKLLTNDKTFCDVWNDNFFEQNKSTYETLYKKSIIYDYAIFIGGKDDFKRRIAESKESYGVRDNVYLELGLYAGILSPSRTFFILNKKCKVASDLNGITIYIYDDIKQIREICKTISEMIDKENSISRIGLLPSASLAIGYYKNFIDKVSMEILKKNNINFNNKNYDVSSYDKKLNIIIPNTTYSNWESEWLMYCTENKLTDTTIQCASRNFGIKFDGKVLKDNKLDFFDCPLTMRISFDAVDFVIGRDFIGDTQTVQIAKQREIDNFISTLNLLINSDAFAKKIICIKNI